MTSIFQVSCQVRYVLLGYATPRRMGTTLNLWCFCSNVATQSTSFRVFFFSSREARGPYAYTGGHIHSRTLARRGNERVISCGERLPELKRPVPWRRQTHVQMGDERKIAPGTKKLSLPLPVGVQV